MKAAIFFYSIERFFVPFFDPKRFKNTLKSYLIYYLKIYSFIFHDIKKCFE